MATFQAGINEDDKNAKNTWRVRIRLYHNKVTKYISTDHYVTKSQLTKKFEIKDQFLIDVLEETMKGYRKKVTALGGQAARFTCIEMKDYVLQDEHQKIDYFVFAKEYIGKINTKGTRDNANTTLNSFIDFIGRPTFEINQLTLATIKKYEEHLRSPRSITRMTNPGKYTTRTYPPATDTGVKDYMTKLKNWYVEAMKHYNDRGKVLIPYNPFDKYVAPKQQATPDKNLSVIQILQLRDCGKIEVGKYKRVEVTEFARDVAMLSFYLLGMNAIDLFQVDSYKKGRISYDRAKTASRRTDNAYISIKIEPEALPLIEKYRDPSGKRVFRFYLMYSNHDGLTKALNTGLKEIGKHLKWEDNATFIWMRYSWPNIARNDCRVPTDDVAQGMNHSDNNHKVTDIYIAKDWTIIDDANRKVLDELSRVSLLNISKIGNAVT